MRIAEIRFEGVSKRFSGRVALDGVSLSLLRGVTGLIGPNGAGKSTLMSILSTAATPTSGRVRCDGADIHRSPERIRPLLGYLPQDLGFYPHLTVLEFLQYMSALKGLEPSQARLQVGRVMAALNLTGVAHRRMGACSGGTRQRAGLAQALLGNPALLILDEPMTGLDPEERTRLRQLLMELAATRLILVSSHEISELASISSRLVLLRAGKVLSDATPAELIRTVADKVWELEVGPDEVAVLRARYLIPAAVREGDRVKLRVIADEVPGAHARPVVPTLEDAYLSCIHASEAVLA